MIKDFAATLALALSLSSLPAAAAQNVIDIELGQSRTQKAGGKTDLYRFAGGSGTTMKASLTASGSSALILYTPAGEEMLSAQGDGSVTLEAILPLWNVFYLGVVRKSGTGPYVLTLSGDVPDTALALFSHMVGFAGGYAPTCWEVPGEVKRQTPTNGKDVSTLVKGGYTTHFHGSDGRSMGTLRTGVEIDGDVVTLTGKSGKFMQYNISALVGKDPGRFTGYYCGK